MADVFLSYAREDRAKAEQIAQALGAGGYDVFWDVEIPPGTSWADFLAEKLASSKAAIVLWSVTSTASQWVREEARLARDKGKLIPAMIDECAPPFGFGEIQAANLAGWNGEADNAHWKLLLAGVARAVGVQPTGTANAAPLRQAVAGGWDSSRAGGGGVAPVSQAPTRKRNWPLLIGASVAGLIVLFGVIGAFVPETKPTTAPLAVGGLPADLSPALQAVVEQARAAQTVGRAASEQASAAAVEANRAANQAQQGVQGFGQIQMDQATTVTGDLTSVQQGRAGGVIMRNTQLGTTFTGALELDLSTGLMKRLTGAFDNGQGGTGLGQVNLNGQQAQSAGRDSTPVYTAEGQGQGVAGAYETQSLGIVTFADGRRYEGQYITRGREAHLLRHGLGVTYAANGAMTEAGRFDSDRLVGAE